MGPRNLKQAKWAEGVIVLSLFTVLGACGQAKRAIAPGALMREIHTDLPPGSTVATVRRWVKLHGFRDSFDPASRTVLFIARDVGGSDLLIRKDLSVRFRFNAELQLTDVQTKFYLTGP